MMSNALALVSGMDLHQLGTMMAVSGFFNDARDASQAAVKIQAGAEVGFPPVASMTGVYIVKGKVSLSANLMAAAIKRHDKGKYNYRIREHTERVCTIEFFEAGQSVGVSTFSVEDAKKAGTQNMDKYARNMLFARAMSNGAKWYCPDVFGGPIYTPEELGEQVTEDGEPVEPKSPPTRQLPAPTAVVVEQAPPAKTTTAEELPRAYASLAHEYAERVREWSGLPRKSPELKEMCIKIAKRCGIRDDLKKLADTEPDHKAFALLITCVKTQTASKTDCLQWVGYSDAAVVVPPEKPGDPYPIVAGEKDQEALAAKKAEQVRRFAAKKKAPADEQDQRTPASEQTVPVDASDIPW